jgi:hypothetical protein
VIVLEEFIIERLASVDSAETKSWEGGDTNLNMMDDEVKEDEG